MGEARDGNFADADARLTAGARERAGSRREERKNGRRVLLFRAAANNMSRSVKKGPWVDPKLLKKVSKEKLGSMNVIKTWSRSSQISPEMIGFIFGVHNGKDFISVTIHEEMVGHRFGEFSPSRKFTRHGGKMQREIEAQAKGIAAPAAPSE